MRRLLLAVVLALAACAGPQIRTNGGPVNLLQVRADVYRSGQPLADEWAGLYARGVRHVIKLNFDNEGSDAEAGEAGIEVHPVPIQPSTKGIDIFAEPSPEVLVMLFKLAERIRDARGREGVWLIHCQNGHDRTGLVVALIRMIADGWTRDHAWREMLDRGYHYPGLFGLDKAFLKLSKVAGL